MVSAMVNDPEMALTIAQATIAQDEEEDDTPSSLRGRSPEAVRLEGIFNLLVSALGGKETWPAPVTAVDLAKEQIAVDAATDVIALMTPWALQDMHPTSS